jgi:hypothetical protein
LGGAAATALPEGRKSPKSKLQSPKQGKKIRNDGQKKRLNWSFFDFFESSPVKPWSGLWALGFGLLARAEVIVFELVAIKTVV